MGARYSRGLDECRPVQNPLPDGKNRREILTGVFSGNLCSRKRFRFRQNGIFVRDKSAICPVYPRIRRQVR